MAAPTDNTYAPRPTLPILPAYIAKALETNRAAWRFFQQLAPTHRRSFVVWIHLAKRDARETHSRIDRIAGCWEKVAVEVNRKSP